MGARTRGKASAIRTVSAVAGGLVAAAVVVLSLLAARAGPLTPVRLQQLIDTTPTGGLLDLPPGVYVGPARIDRPMTLRGRDGVLVDGRREGTVLTVEADDVALLDLTIRRSGDRADAVDAAIRVTGARVRIEGDVIADCLYGIDLRQARAPVVRRNRIASLDGPEGGRGDAIRVWYVTDGLFEGNEIVGVRDGFAVEASGNRFLGNTVRDGRYGMILFYSNDDEITGNRFLDDAVGLMLIWSDRNTIAGNRVRAGHEVAGQALVLKESSGNRILENDFFASAQGVYLDASPKEAEIENVFSRNRFVHDGVAVTFHADLPGDRFEENLFAGNHTDVVVRGGATARSAVWRDNRWDAWEGFDRDGDGIGDTPHEIWSWADRLWMDVPDAQLFRGTPALAALDFVERLAPFTEPRLLLRDPTPRFSESAAVLPPSPRRDRPR